MKGYLPISFIKGVVIGAGAILPGISGASLAVMFGVHEDIVSLLANPFRHLKQFFRRHAFLILGAICGFLAVSRVLMTLIASHTVFVLYLFAGFIAGTLPGIYRQGKTKGGSPVKFLILIIMMGFMVFVATIRTTQTENSNGITDITASLLNEGTLWSPLWIVVGAIVGLGSLLPGVSASFLLIYMGWYTPLLTAVSGFYLAPLCLTGFGAALSLALFSKITSYLYTNFHEATSFGVLGLTLGSLAIVFRNVPAPESLPTCMLLLTAGFLLSFILDIRQNR